MLIGFLVAALVASLIGAGERHASPRYQISVIEGNILVLDNTTNRVTLLYKQRVPGKAQPDWPWTADNSFSLEDAINNPRGAKIEAPIGH